RARFRVRGVGAHEEALHGGAALDEFSINRAALRPADVLRLVPASLQPVNAEDESEREPRYREPRVALEGLPPCRIADLTVGHFVVVRLDVNVPVAELRCLEEAEHRDKDQAKPVQPGSPAFTSPVVAAEGIREEWC